MYINKKKFNFIICDKKLFYKLKNKKNNKIYFLKHFNLFYYLL